MTADEPSGPRGSGPRLFALDGTRRFAERAAEVAGVGLADHEERGFEDGEHKVRPLVSVRDRDVYVLHSLASGPAQSVNDKLCRLLFFLGALRDAGAGRLTAVVPYLCYARKDRRTKDRDPVTIRYVAQLLESVGTDRVVAMDVHDLAAYENAFRIPAENLEARPLLVGHFAPRLGDEDVTVMSPDAGGVKRAEQLRGALEAALGRDVGSAFMEKGRSWGQVTGEALAGPVEGRTVLVVDDLVSTGTTLLRAARACLERDARRVLAAATHGLFVGDADRRLSDPALESVTVTNTVSPPTGGLPRHEEKLEVLDAAPLFGEAVRRLHSGESLRELCGPEWTPGERSRASSR